MGYATAYVVSLPKYKLLHMQDYIAQGFSIRPGQKQILVDLMQCKRDEGRG